MQPGTGWPSSLGRRQGERRRRGVGLGCQVSLCLGPAGDLRGTSCHLCPSVPTLPSTGSTWVGRDRGLDISICTPPGHSDSTPQAAVLHLLPSGPVASSNRPQSPSREPRACFPAGRPPSVAPLCPPFQLSPGSQRRSFHRGGPCPLPTCPGSSGPEDTAAVSCSL